MVSSDESISDLIRGTIRDGFGLVRDEILLARTELREEIVRVKSGVSPSMAAVVVGVLAVDHDFSSSARVGRRLTRSSGRRGRASPSWRCRSLIIAAVLGDAGTVAAVARPLHAEERRHAEGERRMDPSTDAVVADVRDKRLAIDRRIELLRGRLQRLNPHACRGRSGRRGHGRSSRRAMAAWMWRRYRYRHRFMRLP